MAVTIYKNGIVMRSGKNLRILSDYARKDARPAGVQVWPDELDPTRGYVGVLYADGAGATVHFQSLTVAQQWARMKTRYGWPAAVLFCAAPHSVIRANPTGRSASRARIQYQPVSAWAPPGAPPTARPWVAFDHRGTAFNHYVTAAEGLDALRGKGYAVSATADDRAAQADARAAKINATIKKD